MTFFCEACIYIVELLLIKLNKLREGVKMALYFEFIFLSFTVLKVYHALRTDREYHTSHAFISLFTTLFDNTLDRYYRNYGFYVSLVI